LSHSVGLLFFSRILTPSHHSQFSPSSRIIGKSCDGTPSRSRWGIVTKCFSDHRQPLSVIFETIHGAV
jgi:hypothetical protein